MSNLCKLHLSEKTVFNFGDKDTLINKRNGKIKLKEYSIHMDRLQILLVISSKFKQNELLFRMMS